MYSLLLYMNVIQIIYPKRISPSFANENIHQIHLQVACFVWSQNRWDSTALGAIRITAVRVMSIITTIASTRVIIAVKAGTAWSNILV